MNRTKAKGILGVALDIHIYGFACLFLIQALIAAILLCYLVCTRHQKKYAALHYYALLISCMLLLGLSRTLGLFIDPYGLNGYTHELVASINLNLAIAYLASAIYMLLIVLVRVTKMQILSKRVLGLCPLVGIIALNVAVSITSDVIVWLVDNATFVKAICGAYFLTWGTCCTVLFLYVIFKFYKLVYVNRKRLHNAQSASTVSHVTTGTSAASSGNSSSGQNIGRMPVAMKVSVAIFAIFLVHLASLVYDILAMTVLDTDLLHNSDWTWWTIMTVSRGVELAFACAILTMAAIAMRAAR